LDILHQSLLGLRPAYTSFTMVKSCISLIVFVASVNCAPHFNFLGAPGYHGGFYGYGGLPLNYYGGQPITYATETVSPSIYPLRTALDVLNVPAYATGFPHSFTPSLLPTHTVPQASTAEETPVEEIVVVADNEKVVSKDVVDVTVVEEDNTATAGLVPFKQTISALPAPPLSLFRDPTGAPPIPAGIAQATQPQFVLAPFKNSFLSPQLQFVHNSKLSPTLQQIREQSAGIVTSF